MAVSCENPAPFCDLCQRISSLITEMDMLRHAKHFEVADEMRKQFIEIGIAIENTPMGSLWHWKHQFPIFP